MASVREDVNDRSRALKRGTFPHARMGLSHVFKTQEGPAREVFVPRSGRLVDAEAVDAAWVVLRAGRSRRATAP